MDDAKKLQILKIILIVMGIAYIFGIKLLGVLWPSGWVWHGGSGQYYYHMIMGVYAVLGIFLILAAKNPMEHLSLIWFTVWSNLAHALSMGIDAARDSSEYGHLVGDIPALVIFSILLAVFTPRKAKT